jgi:hypothetical protein
MTEEVQCCFSDYRSQFTLERVKTYLQAKSTKQRHVLKTLLMFPVMIGESKLVGLLNSTQLLYLIAYHADVFATHTIGRIMDAKMIIYITGEGKKPCPDH